MVCNLDDPERLAFPLRRGLAWRRRVSELRTEGAGQDLLPGIASLFNGALFRAATVEAVGVPDLRLFVRRPLRWPGGAPASGCRRGRGPRGCPRGRGP